MFSHIETKALLMPWYEMPPMPRPRPNILLSLPSLSLAPGRGSTPCLLLLACLFFVSCALEILSIVTSHKCPGVRFNTGVTYGFQE